uniref:Uncharacterized protein n=1 Tax=Oryza nivara TaxID=4536 RepID=A0A0E0GBE5_ORYNI
MAAACGRTVRRRQLGGVARPMLAAVLALVSALPPPPPPPSPSLPPSPMARLGLDDWAVGLPQVPLVARWSGTVRLGGARRSDKGGAGRWRRSRSDSVSSVGAGLDGVLRYPSSLGKELWVKTLSNFGRMTTTSFGVATFVRVH